MRKWAGAAVVIVAALGPASMGACSTATATAPKEPKACEVCFVTLTVVAGDELNPTTAGDPRPVELRVYQLKDDVRLSSEDFARVWKDDAKVLGPDLVKRSDFFVYPRSRTEVRFERDKEAQFVAAVALFRNPTGRSWFKTFELPPAPGKGDCQAPPPEEGAQNPLNPKYSFWLDGTRVDDGSGHLGDPVDPQRTRVVYLSGASEALSATPAAAASASAK